VPPEAEDEDVIRAVASVQARWDEVAAPRPGDDIAANATSSWTALSRSTLHRRRCGPRSSQLGTQRAGWYLPRSVERFVPRRRRAVRSLNVTWRSLVVGDVIPNYGGRGETSEVPAIEAPSTLVYRSAEEK